MLKLARIPVFLVLLFGVSFPPGGNGSVVQLTPVAGSRRTSPLQLVTSVDVSSENLETERRYPLVASEALPVSGSLVLPVEVQLVAEKRRPLPIYKPIPQKIVVELTIPVRSYLSLETEPPAFVRPLHVKPRPVVPEQVPKEKLYLEDETVQEKIIPLDELSYETNDHSSTNINGVQVSNSTTVNQTTVSENQSITPQQSNIVQEEELNSNHGSAVHSNSQIQNENNLSTSSFGSSNSQSSQSTHQHTSSSSSSSTSSSTSTQNQNLGSVTSEQNSQSSLISSGQQAELSSGSQSAGSITSQTSSSQLSTGNLQSQNVANSGSLSGETISNSSSIINSGQSDNTLSMGTLEESQSQLSQSSVNNHAVDSNLSSGTLTNSTVTTTTTTTTQDSVPSQQILTSILSRVITTLQTQHVHLSSEILSKELEQILSSMYTSLSIEQVRIMVREIVTQYFNGEIQFETSPSENPTPSGGIPPGLNVTYTAHLSNGTTIQLPYSSMLGPQGDVGNLHISGHRFRFSHPLNVPLFGVEFTPYVRPLNESHSNYSMEDIKTMLRVIQIRHHSIQTRELNAGEYFRDYASSPVLQIAPAAAQINREAGNLTLSVLQGCRVLEKPRGRALIGDMLTSGVNGVADLTKAGANLAASGVGGVTDLTKSGANLVSNGVNDVADLAKSHVAGTFVAQGVNDLADLTKGGVRLAAGGVGGISDITKGGAYVAAAGVGAVADLAKCSMTGVGCPRLAENGVVTSANLADQQPDCDAAFQAIQSSYEIYPGTVWGLVLNLPNGFIGHVEDIKSGELVLAEANRISERAHTLGLRLGASVDICTEIHGPDADKKEMLINLAEAVDFFVCSIYPQAPVYSVEEYFQNVTSIYMKIRETFQQLNPSLEIYLQSGVASEGVSKRNPPSTLILNTVEKMSDFWRKMETWSRENQVRVFLHEAFDTPDEPDDQHSGYWKRAPDGSNHYVDKTTGQIVRI